MRRHAHPAASRGLATRLCLGGLLLISAVLAARAWPAEPQLRTGEPLPAWALELYAERLPNISWASARVAHGEPRQLIIEAFRTLEAPPIPGVARALRDLERHLTRPGVQPRIVREQIEALNTAALGSGLPLYADVQFERVPPKTGKWAVWIQTYRVTTVREAETSDGRHLVDWLKRVGSLDLHENRLGWKKASEVHATVLLDVVRRHWREDLAPRLAAKARPAHATHLYRQIRSELLLDLERAVGGPVTEDVECRARFGVALWAEDAADVAPEALECWHLTRSLEPAIVEVLARRIEHHELQHAIDGHTREFEPELAAMLSEYGEFFANEITAETSAVLAEVARGPEPRLTLAHFLSMGAELGQARGIAAELVLRAMSPEGEDAVRLLERPRVVLAHRARRAYKRLFGHEVAEAEVRELAAR